MTGLVLNHITVFNKAGSLSLNLELADLASLAIFI